MLTAAAFTALNAQEQPPKVKPVTVEPVTPVEPVKPIKPVQPIEPVEPVEPISPVEPIEPVTPVEPVEPVLMNDTLWEEVEEADTSVIRIGEKEIIVIDHDDEDEEYENDEMEEEDDDDHWYNGREHKKDRSGRFNGHWEAIELGFNGFHEEDYSAYGGNEFMALDQGKSMEVKINFYELNIGLIKSYVGLVSGMGLSFNSYRFENPYTLRRGDAGVEAIALETENLDKTKLAISYLNVPLLFEFQIPVNQREGRVYVNAGVVGGVKIGSHTKVKYGDDKQKDRSSFHMNPFNYAATARVGYKDMGFFASYSLTPLFEDGKGPELTPFTIGISFSN